jgi:hypothetical protein
VTFVETRGAVHPWLKLRAGDGFYVSTQDGCRFVGWSCPGGGLRCFIADEKFPEDRLIALAADARSAKPN